MTATFKHSATDVNGYASMLCHIFTDFLIERGREILQNFFHYTVSVYVR
jgi:hypothetical protein